MNIGTWFNVYVFDRLSYADRVRQFVDGYLIKELEWRLRELTGAGHLHYSSVMGVQLTLTQPHSIPRIRL